jgi:hypothetical protein
MSKLITCFLLLSGLAVATAARADDKTSKAAAPAPEPAKMKWEEACAPDVKKLCQAEASGDVRPCLAKHEKELSKECTNHFSAAGYRVAELCANDIERLCHEAALNDQLAKCMTAKQAQLSAKCREALTKGSAQQKNPPGDKAAATTPKKKAKKAKQ